MKHFRVEQKQVVAAGIFISYSLSFAEYFIVLWTKFRLENRNSLLWFGTDFVQG